MLIDADRNGALDGTSLVSVWDDTYANPEHYLDRR